MGEFEGLRENWLRLVRQTKLDKANFLYWEKLFPVIEEKFLENKR